MKIIFLDIDGVLNSEEWYKSVSVRVIEQEPNFNPSNTEYNFDPSVWKWIQKLIDETGAKIVLSSSWRYWSLQATIDNLVGVTPGLMSRCRGQEIKRFFENMQKGNDDVNEKYKLQIISDLHEKIESYVIIDDDCDFTKEQLPHLVQTDSLYGMTENDYLKALKILNIS